MSLIYPMFAMVLLTFYILIKMFRSRLKSVKDGSVDPKFYKVYQGGEESETSQKLARHFVHLFETPVLFYVACLAAMQMGITGYLFLALAWVFVLLRIVHAYIHIGKNRLQPRIRAYFASWIVLLLMWAVLVVQVALHP